MSVPFSLECRSPQRIARSGRRRRFGYDRGRFAIPNETGEAMPINKSFIGQKGEPVTMHVERGKIREFARAIKDDDPVYFDEAQAKQIAGGILPPPPFSIPPGL